MAKRRTKQSRLPMPEWSARLEQKLEELGWSVAELARRMGHGGEQTFLDNLYKYVNGAVKNPRGEMLELIAEAVGWSGSYLRYGPNSEAGRTMSNVHRLREDVRVPTLGEVAANVWRGVEIVDQAHLEETELVNPPDPRYPVDAQYDLVVRGTSINRVARDGDRLRVIDIRKSEVGYRDNDLVVVQRTRDDGQIVETTAKRVIRTSGGIELWPDSDDPQWQTPLSLSDDSGRDQEVQIKGLVIYAYRPARKSR